MQALIKRALKLMKARDNAVEIKDTLMDQGKAVSRDVEMKDVQDEFMEEEMVCKSRRQSTSSGVHISSSTIAVGMQVAVRPPVSFIVLNV
jgi:hypothetical protein